MNNMLSTTSPSAWLGAAGMSFAQLLAQGLIMRRLGPASLLRLSFDGKDLVSSGSLLAVIGGRKPARHVAWDIPYISRR